MSHNNTDTRKWKCSRVQVSICLLFLAVSANALALDWPCYMHDNARSGVTAESLMLADLDQGWVYESPAPPMRAWSDGPPWDAYSQGNAVPMRDFDTAFFVSVVGENVYFGSSVTNSVHCIDVLTGEQKWFYRTDGAVRFPPSHSDGKLYFGSDDGYAYCVDALNGSLIWKYCPSSDQRAIMNNGNLISMWPVRTGTAVLEGKVYFAASLVPWQSTYLCAVDAETGSVSGTGHYSTSGGIAPNGAILLSDQYIYLPQGRYYPHVFNRGTGASAGVLNGTAGTFALLTSDGASTGFVYGPGRFSASNNQLTGNNDRIASYSDGKCLVVANDTSYTITETSSVETTLGYKHSHVTRLKALDRTNGGVKKWKHPCDTRRFTVILAGDVLYTGGVGKVEAHSIADGSVLWSAPVNGRARGLAVANERLFVSTDTGKIYMFGSSSVPADFDRNGTVDIDDLTTLLGDYLQCTDPEKPDCTALDQ